MRSSSLEVSWDDESHCTDYNLNLVPAAQERISISRSHFKQGFYTDEIFYLCKSYGKCESEELVKLIRFQLNYASCKDDPR